MNVDEFIKNYSQDKKVRRLISLDEQLIIKLKQLPNLNVSGLVNSFLWYYLKREGLINGPSDK